MSRIGTEFQVNSYTTSSQFAPSVATDSDGDFVVVWSSHDGSSYGVFARRFSSAGESLASEFQVNAFTTGYQGGAKVAADADGDFVVAWASFSQDGDGLGVFARRFSSAGVAVAAELQVNTYATGGQYSPSLAMESDGDFIITWQSFGQDGGLPGVFARLFSSSGNALATEFQVNTYTTNSQSGPRVAMDDSHFVIVWNSNGQDGSSFGVFGQRFSSTGVAIATEFQVSTYTSNAQRYPSLAADADGDFVVAWSSNGQDGNLLGVFARRFSSAGVPQASEFQLNTRTIGDQRFPSVAAEPDGGFVIAWDAIAQDGSNRGVFAQRFSSTGAPITTEFQVNSYTSNDQYGPQVAVDANGGFIVVWQSYPQDGSFLGIFAQRFAAAVPMALDIDGNGAVEPLIDGLLVLRYLFGFTGTTLTDGAIGGGCARCDAAAIETHLAGLGLVLDVDGNGVVEPLTDGLLVLRYLFGFTGTTLTSGAVGGGCTRCDAATIETYLAGLT